MLQNEKINIGGEPEKLPGNLRKEKEDVNPYDIFRLAKGILIIAAAIYISLACIRIFYTRNNIDGVKEIWEYSKMLLNSIISLVLGLYFGSSQRNNKT